MLVHQHNHDTLQALPTGTWAAAETQAGMETQAWRGTQPLAGSCAEAGRRPAQDSHHNEYTIYKKSLLQLSGFVFGTF